MLDRLFLDQERIAGIAKGIRALIDLPDPIGEVLDPEVLENGLEIRKVRVAKVVIGIIYESRPNVTSDAAALAIKSGNAVVLRTGKDAFHSASSDRDSPQCWIGRSRTPSRSSPTDPR